MACAKHQGDGDERIERQGDQQRPFERLVHHVVAVNRQQCTDQHHRDGHNGRIESEDMLEATHDERNVHHVEADEHKHRRHQRKDHAAIAELGTRLDHLRKAHLRPLRSVESHKNGAEHDTERTRQGSP
ncbi:hypothetical protein D3C85_1186400 [compost metagenome]